MDEDPLSDTLFGIVGLAILAFFAWCIWGGVKKTLGNKHGETDEQ